MFVSTKNLSDERASSGVYGNVVEEVKKILSTIPKNKGLKLSIIKDLLIKETQLPYRQAYTRLNHISKTDWFKKEYVKKYDGGTAYICKK